MADSIKGFKTKTGNLKYDYESLDNIPENLANVDLSNLSDEGNIYAGGLGYPDKNHTVELTLPTTGSILTAPANGYYHLRHRIGTASTTSQQQIGLYTDTVGNRCITMTSNTLLDVSVPVFKGDSVTVEYTSTGSSSTALITKFTFAYAKGSESEAS